MQHASPFCTTIQDAAGVFSQLAIERQRRDELRIVDALHQSRILLLEHEHQDLRKRQAIHVPDKTPRVDLVGAGREYSLSAHARAGHRDDKLLHTQDVDSLETRENQHKIHAPFEKMPYRHESVVRADNARTGFTPNTSRQFCSMEHLPLYTIWSYPKTT